jgi:hypothetical protein
MSSMILTLFCLSLLILPPLWIMLILWPSWRLELPTWSRIWFPRVRLPLWTEASMIKRFKSIAREEVRVVGWILLQKMVLDG